MARASRSQADETRRRVVETASALLRERGTAVSVADLMHAAGLTHGGFYKHFESKSALVDEATSHAFSALAKRHNDTIVAHSHDRIAAQQQMIDEYLAPEHRDDPAGGCPVAALVTDLGRDDSNDAARATFAEGVRDFASVLDTGTDDGLARLATMVGALLISRALTENPLSDEVLRQVRASLLSPDRVAPAGRRRAARKTT